MTARTLDAAALAALVDVHGSGTQRIAYCPECGTNGERSLVRCGDSVLPVGPYPYPGSACLRHAKKGGAL